MLLDNAGVRFIEPNTSRYSSVTWVKIGLEAIITKAAPLSHTLFKADRFSFLHLCSFLSLALKCFLTCSSESLSLLHLHILQLLLLTGLIIRQFTSSQWRLIRVSLQIFEKETGPGWVVSILTSAVWPRDWCLVVLCPLDWAEGVDFEKGLREVPWKGDPAPGREMTGNAHLQFIYPFSQSSCPSPSANIELFYILVFNIKCAFLTAWEESEHWVIAYLYEHARILSLFFLCGQVIFIGKS